MTRASALCFVIGVLLASPGTLRADSCTTCHARLWQEALRVPALALGASVHGVAGLGCRDCHGGRDGVGSVLAHDPSAGFVPRPGPVREVEICGGCHADETRVPEGLATDQLQIWRRSAHGEALPNNPRVATCSRCHGAHDVRHVDDPRSTVHPDRIVETCGVCHSSRSAMHGSSLPTDQERRFQESVHGIAATSLPADEERRPSCVGCHDGHGARAGTVATDRCGRCHPAPWAEFRDGPHHEIFERLGFNACAECHGSHGIEPADPTLVGVGRGTACRRCHGPGQAMYEVIAELGDRTRSAEALARRALRRVDEDDPERRRVLDGRRELRLALHALDARRVEAAAADLSEVAARVGPRAIPAGEPAAGRPWALAAAGAAAVLVGAVLWWVRRRWSR